MERLAGFAQRTGLPFRDAFADWAHVGTRLAWEGAVAATPVVTIAITTYQRAEFLVDAIQSVRDQDFDRRYEIIIRDNDPQSTGPEELLERLPALRDENVRYFVNGENFGVFGNFNRCITMARGTWLTILNDDDLLDPNYLSLMFAELDRNAAIDGIVSRKRFLDEHAVAPAAAGTRHGAGRSGILSAFLHNPRVRGPARAAKMRLRDEYLFLGQTSRPIAAAKFFWGSILGNGAGFLFRKESAIAMGGFYVEEYPSSDYWFYARFASLFHLRQHRAKAATVRITGVNLSSSTAIVQLEQGSRLQRLLAGTAAPRWWLRYLPLMLACGYDGFNTFFRANVSKQEVEAALGIALPAPDMDRLVRLRLLFRAE